MPQVLYLHMNYICHVDLVALYPTVILIYPRLLLVLAFYFVIIIILNIYIALSSAPGVDAPEALYR